MRSICVLFPSPDYAFILVANANVVQRRRHDLSVLEIERQTAEYKRLSKWYQNILIVNAGSDLEEVISRVSQDIIGVEKNPIKS